MTNRLLITLALAAFPVLLFAQDHELLGTWESLDPDEPVHMILDEEGFITFKVNGQLMGGKGYNVDGNLVRMTYKTHVKQSKLKITITIKDLMRKEVLKRDTGTIVFKDPNNIEMCFKKPSENEMDRHTNDCRNFLKIM
ncbi:MAG: hypothetical protein KJO49_01170 [Bacteroidia bacterium]|nr:hypothetical protein [Bacteroidia bacterium]MBT8269738.1 hypothetical protein [Bacteroidia bacterium]NNF81430.1 hypothetical protein [Flavobacteriaceae bacterium]NNK69110.1 hypothetical protein [Flavobacteriaceae bacterium]NNL79027.1 hypothetical protein [Flavobacteriaceae bacterium]